MTDGRLGKQVGGRSTTNVLHAEMTLDESKSFEAELMIADAKHANATSQRAPLRRRAVVAAVALLSAFTVVAAANYSLVEAPVAAALKGDRRNADFTLRAHFGYYVSPQTLVLDLVEVGAVAPVDLFRALFQAAEALHESGRAFERIILARDGEPVFVLSGSDFTEIGVEYGVGQNPVFLIRTLPEKLVTPSGQRAFGSWSGGWLGVLNEQMDDANAAAQRWASLH